MIFPKHGPVSASRDYLLTRKFSQSPYERWGALINKLTTCQTTDSIQPFKILLGKNEGVLSDDVVVSVALSQAHCHMAGRRFGK